jgi:hypothetical protein
MPVWLPEENPPAHVTLPTVPWLDKARQHDAQIVQEAKESFSEQRIVRAGIEAWATVAKSESLECWKAIGAALSIGRRHALRVSGSNAPIGRRYAYAFCEWAKLHGFGKMDKQTRSVVLDFYGHIDAIEIWLATLGERERKGLRHPLSITRRWRQSLSRQPRLNVDAETYLRTAINIMHRVAPENINLPPDDLQFAIGWLQALAEQQAAQT